MAVREGGGEGGCIGRGVLQVGGLWRGIRPRISTTCCQLFLLLCFDGKSAERDHDDYMMQDDHDEQL